MKLYSTKRAGKIPIEHYRNDQCFSLNEKYIKRELRKIRRIIFIENLWDSLDFLHLRPLWNKLFNR